MKKAIHPKIYTDCVVKCVCGNQFTTISTVPSIVVDICSNCHPLFTGQQKLIDTEGRIDKFNKRAKQMEEKKQKHQEVKAAKQAKKPVEGAPKRAPSLKELLAEVKETEPADKPKAENQ